MITSFASLGMRVSRGGSDHFFSDGSHARLLLKNAIRDLKNNFSHGPWSFRQIAEAASLKLILVRMDTQLGQAHKTLIYLRSQRVPCPSPSTEVRDRATHTIFKIRPRFL
ncbi:hypothetical protein EVAR_97891_1 [Eumeta japonica]|uniref:Uncharacterized protein n=1 Tax=Eumeta variegata TaxID=151549 RepID=A0A4C1WHI8_EUMVA|nr:hypothetical protein EVAR_97891_1 [Eumeta japonica]